MLVITISCVEDDILGTCLITMNPRYESSTGPFSSTNDSNSEMSSIQEKKVSFDIFDEKK